MALSAAGVSSSVRESSKPAARRSSALGANSQVCSGDYLQPKTSWLCAVLAPAVDSLTFGKRDSMPTLPAMIAWRLPPNRRNLSHAHGLPPGVLMIDDNWQEDYGKWTFHPGRFTDPKAMVNELH